LNGNTSISPFGHMMRDSQPPGIARASIWGAFVMLLVRRAALADILVHAALSSFSAPRATIFSEWSGSGRCSALAQDLILGKTNPDLLLKDH
jgi:hypothetical protein